MTYTVNYDKDDCPSLINATEPGPIRLRVPKGIKGDELMKIAAEKDEKYKFAVKHYTDLGSFITAINNVKMSEVQNYYWMLYYKPAEDDDFHLSDVGISSLQPSNGSVVKFLYQHPKNC